MKNDSTLQQPLQDVAKLIEQQNPHHLLSFLVKAIETVLLKTKDTMNEEAYDSVGGLITSINNIIPAFFDGAYHRTEAISDGLTRPSRHAWSRRIHPNG